MASAFGEAKRFRWRAGENGDRARAAGRLLGPLVDLKCAAPQGCERQRVGLAVYLVSQRLVCHLLNA